MAVCNTVLKMKLLYMLISGCFYGINTASKDFTSVHLNKSIETTLESLKNDTAERILEDKGNFSVLEPSLNSDQEKSSNGTLGDYQVTPDAKTDVSGELCENKTCINNSSAQARTTRASVTAQLRRCQIYKLTYAIIIACLVPFGLVGNIISVIVLRRFDTHLSTPFLLSALHISDCLLLPLFFILRCVPAFSSFNTYWAEFFRVYAVLAVYGWPCVIAIRGINTWVTLLVALHRYIAVVMPHRSATLCRVSVARKQLFFFILFPLLFALPGFFNYYPKRSTDEFGRTSYSLAFTELGKNKYYIFGYKTAAYYTVMYFVPLAFLIYFTACLIKTVKKAKKRRSEMTGKESSANDTTWTLIVIVLVFLICQIWEPIRKILESFWPNPQDRECGSVYFYYTELPSLASVVNSSVNFIIYCLLGRKFRESLMKTFGCGGKEDSKTGTFSSVMT